MQRLSDVLQLLKDRLFYLQPVFGKADKRGESFRVVPFEQGAGGFLGYTRIP